MKQNNKHKRSAKMYNEKRGRNFRNGKTPAENILTSNEQIAICVQTLLDRALNGELLSVETLLYFGDNRQPTMYTENEITAVIDTFFGC